MGGFLNASFAVTDSNATEIWQNTLYYYPMYSWYSDLLNTTYIDDNFGNITVLQAWYYYVYPDCDIPNTEFYPCPAFEWRQACNGTNFPADPDYP